MAEEHICGENKIHGGEFEWVCILPPHPSKKLDLNHHQGETEVGDHYFKAFKKVA